MFEDPQWVTKTTDSNEPSYTGLAKKPLTFVPYDGSSSTYLSLTSLKTILLDYIVTAVI